MTEFEAIKAAENNIGTQFKRQHNSLAVWYICVYYMLYVVECDK